jgi:hypothetical protein
MTCSAGVQVIAETCRRALDEKVLVSLNLTLRREWEEGVGRMGNDLLFNGIMGISRDRGRIL